jgi:hypothetical protein
MSEQPNQPEQPRSTMLEISSIANLPDLDGPDLAVIDWLKSHMKSKTLGTLQELRNALIDQGYALVETFRDPEDDEAEDLDSYALVRIIDENGDEIPPQVIDQKLEEIMIATVTFQIQ